MLKHFLLNNKKLNNNMRNIIFFALILYSSYSAQSQDFQTEYNKQLLINDSLQNKVIKPLKKELKESIEINKSEISLLKARLVALENDTVAILKKKILDLNKEIVDLNKNKLAIENGKLLEQIKLLTTKNNELNLLKEKNNILIANKDNQIKEIAIKEKENGKKEVITTIINSYKNKKFDNLILISTKESVLGDKQLIGNNSEINGILSDLEIYFKGKELLYQKIDVNQLNTIKTELSQIKQQSNLITTLKKNLESYNSISTKLKETIENIRLYDDKSSKKYMIGEGIDKPTRDDKLNKIFSILMPYILDYDLKYNDYPYLFDIVLDIIKRKQSNTDEDISDLLKKI